MPQRAVRVLTAAAALGLALPAAGLTPAPTRDERFYYEIGGAAAVSPPPSRLSTTTLGASFELGIRYSCGKFDPIRGIATQLDQVIERIKALVVNALSAAIAAAPMYILEREPRALRSPAEPAAQSRACRQSRQCKLRADGALDRRRARPLHGVAAGGQSRELEGRDGRRRPALCGGRREAALDRVEAQGGAQGLPWFEGRRAGGEGQPPIRVIGDTATAGYNLMLNRAAGDQSAPSGALSQERIVELWPSPERLHARVTDVLGEVTVHTGEAPSNTRAGAGLLKQVNAAQTKVQARLNQIVAGGAPTLSDLDKLSAGGIAVTRELIESIRALAPIERGIVMQKLAAEIATARVMEQALLARRALLAGRREPNISASPAATEQGVLARSLSELDREIEDLLFEARVRREVISDTAQAVLRREEARRERAAGPTEVPAVDPRAVRCGAVPVP